MYALLTPNAVLQKGMEKCDPQTWRELARRLHVEEVVLHTWKHRGGRYSDDAAALLADMLGMPFELLIAVREAHTEKHDERRNRWLERLGKRRGDAQRYFGFGADLSTKRRAPA